MSDIKLYCNDKELKCLSKKCKNMHDRLFWRCCCGNEWTTTFGKIKERNVRSCKSCAVKRQHGKRKEGVN